MPWIWSNPDPSNQTMAAQTAQTHLSAPEIGSLVSAILHYRQSQDEELNKSIASAGSGIASGISGFQQAGQASSAVDSANRGQFLQEHPEAMSDLERLGPSQFDQQYVPDYGYNASWRNGQFTGVSGGPGIPAGAEADNQTLRNLLLQAEIGRKLTEGQREMTPYQGILAASRNVDAQKNAFDQFGIPESVLNNPNATHAPSTTPYSYGSHTNAEGSVVKDDATTVPPGQFLLVNPEDDTYHYTTPDYLAKARAAHDAYMNAQKNYNNVLSGDTSGQVPTGVYGPVVGENGHDQLFGPLNNRLTTNGVALGTEQLKHFPLLSWIMANGKGPYQVQDKSFVRPDQPNANMVEFRDNPHPPNYVQLTPAQSPSVAPQAPQSAPTGSVNQAIQILQANGKPVTDANIRAMLQKFQQQ